MGRVIDEIIAEAQAAEASGWDGCFLTEHHQQEDGYLPNPLLLAGLVGMKTERLKVGTCVLLMPLHHPVHVAEDCAVIDQATKGRLVLSIGVGYQPHDFEAFEIPITERAPRTEEAVDIIRKSWTGERFSFEGKHFHYKDTLITPGPRQQPGPPIWMASWTPVGLRRAGRLADGWIADPVQSLGVIKDYASRYRAAAQKAGRKPYICLMRDAVLADSMAEAEAASAPTMYTHRFYFQYDAYVPGRTHQGCQDARRADLCHGLQGAADCGFARRLPGATPDVERSDSAGLYDHALSTAGRPVAREHAASHTHFWRESDSEVVGRVSFSVTLNPGPLPGGEGEDNIWKFR